MMASFLFGVLAGSVATLLIIGLCLATRTPATPLVPPPPAPSGKDEKPDDKSLRAGEHIRAGSELELRDGVAYEREPLDIWPARLGNLVVWSGLFAVKQPWIGTAVELRAALCAETSRLNWRNKRELPIATTINDRLTAMRYSRGRVAVELLGFSAGGPVWSLTENQGENEFAVTGKATGPAAGVNTATGVTREAISEEKKS